MSGAVVRRSCPAQLSNAIVRRSCPAQLSDADVRYGCPSRIDVDVKVDELQLYYCMYNLGLSAIL